MNFSVQGISKMIRFLEPSQNVVLHFVHPPQDTHLVDVVTGKETASELYRDTSSYDECLFPTLMTEIQLKNIVDRLQSEKRTPRQMVMKLWFTMV